jgi:hypothetical protein
MYSDNSFYVRNEELDNFIRDKILPKNDEISVISAKDLEPINQFGLNGSTYSFLSYLSHNFNGLLHGSDKDISSLIIPDKIDSKGYYGSNPVVFATRLGSIALMRALVHPEKEQDLLYFLSMEKDSLLEVELHAPVNKKNFSDKGFVYFLKETHHFLQPSHHMTEFESQVRPRDRFELVSRDAVPYSIKFEVCLDDFRGFDVNEVLLDPQTLSSSYRRIS